MDSNADAFRSNGLTILLQVEACGKICWKISRKLKVYLSRVLYIVEGLMWNKHTRYSEQKAAQGVEVKIHDDIGCMATLPGDYIHSSS